MSLAIGQLRCAKVADITIGTDKLQQGLGLVIVVANTSACVKSRWDGMDALTDMLST
jgi:hypothetical protein